MSGAGSFRRLLGSGENAPTERARELDERKERRWIEVILTGLIDHPQLAMLLGLSIRNDLINLAALQGYLVTLVAETESELA
jgi:hypothetical protein